METPKHPSAKTPNNTLSATWYLPLIIKAIKPPLITATALKPIVGPIADTNKPNTLVDEAIALEICKSKNDPKTIPRTATPQAIIIGNLKLFIKQPLSLKL